MERIEILGHIQDLEKIEIAGKIVRLPYPDEIPEFALIGREDIIDLALAAWSTIEGIRAHPFRLWGRPGVGKNSIIYGLTRILNKNLYIINGHDELRAEDVACNVVPVKNKFEYVASPLLTAMLKGGICLFDEIEKAPPRSLVPLGSVLDERHTLTSMLAGIRIKAHPDFLFCAASNEDEDEGTNLPPYIDERTRPSFKVGNLPMSQLREILITKIPSHAEQWIQTFMGMFKDSELSTRRSIEILENAYKLYKRKNGTALFNRVIAEQCMKIFYKHDHQDNERALFEKPLEGRTNADSKIFTVAEETIH
jgi:AAA domain (dynein-related subfamily)